MFRVSECCRTKDPLSPVSVFIIYLIAYANILTVRTYVLKTRTYDKMQTEIFKVGPNNL